MLKENDRKAALSYAYLHTVAAAAGFSCKEADRNLDKAGVDAQIDIDERMDPGIELRSFSLHVQLKSTSRRLPIVDGKLSYLLDVGQYDKLRSTAVAIPRLIVLLTLPEDSTQWVSVSAQELVARHCARWTCIYGAPESANRRAATVRFDLNRVLTPAELRDIARRVVLEESLS
jgi:hypothetical protein